MFFSMKNHSGSYKHANSVLRTFLILKSVIFLESALHSGYYINMPTFSFSTIFQSPWFFSFPWSYMTNRNDLWNGSGKHFETFVRCYWQTFLQTGYLETNIKIIYLLWKVIFLLFVRLFQEIKQVCRIFLNTKKFKNLVCFPKMFWKHV
jgi:hypothetical protein